MGFFLFYCFPVRLRFPQFNKHDTVRYIHIYDISGPFNVVDTGTVRSYEADTKSCFINTVRYSMVYSTRRLRVRVPAHFQESSKYCIRKSLAFWIFRDPRVYQTHHGFSWKSKNLRKWKPACEKLRFVQYRTTFLEVRGHPYYCTRTVLVHYLHNYYVGIVYQYALPTRSTIT